MLKTSFLYHKTLEWKASPPTHHDERLTTVRTLNFLSHMVNEVTGGAPCCKVYACNKQRISPHLSKSLLRCYCTLTCSRSRPSATPPSSFSSIGCTDCLPECPGQVRESLRRGLTPTAIRILFSRMMDLLPAVPLPCALPWSWCSESKGHRLLSAHVRLKSTGYEFP